MSGSSLAGQLFSYPVAIDQLESVLRDRQPRTLAIDGFRSAAVAVLLQAGRRERSTLSTRVILTVRSEDMRTHSGQVALPGGTCDHGDDDAIATALRETEEELGVCPAALRVLGVIDDVATPSRFVITPVVCAAPQELIFRVNHAEVAEVFDAPLAIFADPSRAESIGARHFQGHSYEMRAYHAQGHPIWGVTAAILEQLCRVLAESEGTAAVVDFPGPRGTASDR